jgi:hypothetical protein
MSLSDILGSLTIRRKVNILPSSPQDSLRFDCRTIACRRAVGEQFRRRYRRQTEINRQLMPLVGADAQTILADGESLFVALGYGLTDFPNRQIHTGSTAQHKQLDNIRPPPLIQYQANDRWFVTQYQAEELTHIEPLSGTFHDMLPTTLISDAYNYNGNVTF